MIRVPFFSLFLFALAVAAAPRTNSFVHEVPPNLREAASLWRRPLEAHPEVFDRQDDRKHPGPQGYTFDPCSYEADCITSHTKRLCVKTDFSDCLGNANCFCFPEQLQICKTCEECLDAPGETCGTTFNAVKDGEGFCISNYTIYEGILGEVGCDSFPWVTPFPPLESATPITTPDFLPSLSSVPSYVPDMSTPTPEIDSPMSSVPPATPDAASPSTEIDLSESNAPFMSPIMETPTFGMGTKTPDVVAPSMSSLPTMQPDVGTPSPEVPFMRPSMPFPSTKPMTVGYTFDTCMEDTDCIAPRTCKSGGLDGPCNGASNCICAHSQLSYCTSCNDCEAYPKEICAELISRLSVGVCVSSTLLKLDVKEIGCELLFPTSGADESTEPTMEVRESEEPSEGDLSGTTEPIVTVGPVMRNSILSTRRYVGSGDGMALANVEGFLDRLRKSRNARPVLY